MFAGENLENLSGGQKSYTVTLPCVFPLLTPVVQKMDNAIHRINHYPVNSAVCFVNTYPLNSNLSGE